MRQLRSSGSVEGVMGNHDPYSDSPCAGGHRKVNQSALRALAAARRPFGVRSDVQARLSCGLAAPRNVGLHPAQAKSIISPTRMYFHALRMSQSDMTTQVKDVQVSRPDLRRWPQLQPIPLRWHVQYYSLREGAPRMKDHTCPHLRKIMGSKGKPERLRQQSSPVG